MPRWEERSEVKTQKITDMLKQNETKDRSVIEAEVMWVNFLVEHGIPFIASEHVGKLFATIFPDWITANPQLENNFKIKFN